MGDREQFNIMPSIASTIDPSPTARALPFKHENEIAQPDYYSVSFENGIKTEIAPASHSAIFRITFPSDQNAGTIIFDSRRGDVSSYEFKFDTSNNTLAGYVDNKSGMSAGASKMYLYAKFSQSFTNVSGNEYIIFDKSVNKEPVLMNIGSSYISEAQAQKNLSLEIGETSFEQLRNQATQK
jgi:putative alpha-1,2-mannosidase